MIYSHQKKVGCAISAMILIGGIFWYANSQKQAEMNQTKDWQTQSSQGISFKYPKELGTHYMSLQDWPPMVQVLSERFSCTEAGLTTDRAGETKKVVFGGHTYCVTTINEGAAGSTYTQYAYAFAKGSKTIILTFTTRSPQCGNYEEPEKNACELEQSQFDLHKIVDQIAQSIEINN